MTALLALLFVITVPALAVARQAVDPLAYAGICRIDTGIAGDSAPSGSQQSRSKPVHCPLCPGTVVPPPAVDLGLAMVVRVAESDLPAARDPFTARDPAAFRPLNPRAPPRR